MARRCEYDPAFQWLTGLEEVNYHTLADFRVEKQKELDGLFTQVLAALSKEGLITLEQVMQDGTKIKALASTRSYQREGTIQGHLERARQRVAEMGDPRNEEANPKAKQAQARARREQQERLESALEELQKLQERKSGEQAKRDARVSTSDPQARVMHHSDGGLSLSYNAQISTDAANGLIVGVAVTQEANDSAQLLPAVDRVEQQLKKKPQQLVADGGYTTRDNIEKLAGREIDFLGSIAVGKCAEWSQSAEPTPTERLPLSAGEKSLRLPGGQSPASAGTTPETARADVLPLPSQSRRLPNLPAQAGVLSEKCEARPFGGASRRKSSGERVSQEDG